mmetsp:Transcript_22917/g.39048  ORF Transcript_22917/g.39048 Transcript_22917/m.39048 type:complete len:355 (-) Transcript_22917:192-1256(-)
MMFGKRYYVASNPLVACTMMILAAISHVKLVTSFVVAPRTVVAPSLSKLYMSSCDESPPTQEVHISIEYCSGCQWMLRSTWMASEILTTFASDASLSSLSLIPKGPPLSEGGIFRITAKRNNSQGADSGKNTLLWDRKIEGRFPESKEVKQLIRDLVDPGKDLGHSDKQQGDDGSSSKEADCVECKEQQQDDPKQKLQESSELAIPDIFYNQDKVSIEYSTGVVSSPDNGLYRANFYANELLSCAYERNTWWKQYQLDNGDEKTAASAPVVVDKVTLIPNRKLIGTMKIELNEEMAIYDHSKEADDEYIDASRLRKMVIRAITHGDISLSSGEIDIDLLDEEEAEDARKYFGVF